MDKITGGSHLKAYKTDKNKPIVSIIIATFNAQKHLQNCLDSIINQRFQNIELIVFDGASKDDTLKILYKNDRHISYWQSEPDKGIYYALNNAAKYATGDWIYFLGSDDRLLDGFSDMAEKLIDKHTLYYGYCLRKGIQTNRAANAYWIVKYNICHHSIFYPSVVFKKYSYNPKYVVYADHAMHIQVWADKSIGKQYYPLPIADYGAYGFSTTTRDEAFRKDKLSWVRKYMGWLMAWRYLVKRRKMQKQDPDYF